MLTQDPALVRCESRERGRAADATGHMGKPQSGHCSALDPNLVLNDGYGELDVTLPIDLDHGWGALIGSSSGLNLTGSTTAWLPICTPDKTIAPIPIQVWSSMIIRPLVTSG
jgi:hypothetical protein